MSFRAGAVLRGMMRTGRLLTAAVIALLLAGGVSLWWYLGPHREGTHFSAMFTESIGIYPGSDVRILGVAVGTVDAVVPRGTDVEIDMHLDRGISVRADTRAVIIAPSLVSDRYVQLTGVYGGGPKLADGTQIPLSRTATPVEIDDLSRSVVALTRALGPNGANRNGALADLLRVSAANLRGNGPAIKQMIDQFGQASATLAGSRKDLFRTLDNLAKFTATLARDDGSVRGLNTSLSAVTRVLADDRQSFAAALHDLSGALSTVKGFIDRNRGLISANVHKLALITETLTKERDSLAQALRAAPMAVDNLLNAYDPQHNVLVGRGDLNELSLWPGGPRGSAPPALLPATGATTVSGGH
ncbi:MAG TPA: MCE family protein [Jatrophihabitans sp.]|nr:MCE family protein [Jatrophihabitans sp.]